MNVVQFKFEESEENYPLKFPKDLPGLLVSTDDFVLSPIPKTNKEANRVSGERRVENSYAERVTVFKKE